MKLALGRGVPSWRAEDDTPGFGAAGPTLSAAAWTNDLGARSGSWSLRSAVVNEADAAPPARAAGETAYAATRVATPGWEENVTAA